MPENKKRKLYGDADDVMSQSDSDCCGVSFLRNFMYIFNFIFLLSGMSLLGVTVWLWFYNMEFVSYFLSPIYRSIMYISLACSILIIFIFYTGCSGARLPKSSCLGCFATFLLLIFLMQISIGILAFCYQFMVNKELLGSLNRAIMQTYGVDEAATTAVDQLQQQLKCCGSTSHEDWKGNPWLSNNTLSFINKFQEEVTGKRNNVGGNSNIVGGNSKNVGGNSNNVGGNSNDAGGNFNNVVVLLRVPDSCCITKIDGCGWRIHPSNINTNGCAVGLELVVSDRLNLIGSLGLGFCCLQIFGIIFSCCLVKKLQSWKMQDGKMMLL